VTEYVGDRLAAWPSGKYSPIEVAQWLEDLAAAAQEALQSARVKATSPGAAEFRRMEEDVLLQAGLGLFFAKKLRCAVLWEIGQKTGDARASAMALARYKEARATWAAMAQRARGVYRADIGYGDVPMRRGHWMDRLATIDEDIAAMQTKVDGAGAAPGKLSPAAERAVQEATGRPSRPNLAVTHQPAESFAPGAPLEVELEVGKGAATEEMTARLRYRHVDQAERWQWLEMESSSRGYKGAIPGDYTHSVFPLEYYFELRRAGEAWLHPGFNATLSNQPYFAVWRRSQAK
jgi:hypothetical protein